MAARVRTTSSSSVLPETDSDVGMLSVSESESSGTGSTVLGPGVLQVSPRVSLLSDRLRTPQRSDLTRKRAIRRNMLVAQRGSVRKK